ncbi:MAG: serine/threonine protein kinase, partial [Myxococcales bacterium]|nr:serine/threonine protein kinase [Myxococcales bacterium]
KKVFLAKLGPYNLLDRIASGGMGAIHLASLQRDAGFERLLALKTILPHLEGDASFVAMFEAEARLAARLHHPNIVQIYDFGRVEGQAFIAMEYIDGFDLRSATDAAQRQGSPLPLGVAIYVGACGARALDYAWNGLDARGEPLRIIHRDVSPQNILLSMQGEVKLTDFGLAKTLALDGGSNSGLLKGKLAYMAPEQVRGEPVGPAADIFALGAVLYELVSGRRLYPPDIALGDLLMRVNDARFEPLGAVAPALPEALITLISRCLSTSPQERPESGAALASSLLGAAEDARLRATALELAGWLRPLADARRLVVERKADGTVVARRTPGGDAATDSPEPRPVLEATAAAGQPIRSPVPSAPSRASGVEVTVAPPPMVLEETQLAAVPPRRRQTMRLDPAELPVATLVPPPRRPVPWLGLSVVVVALLAVIWFLWPKSPPGGVVPPPMTAMAGPTATTPVSALVNDGTETVALPSPADAPDVSSPSDADVALLADAPNSARRDAEPEVARLERLTLSVTALVPEVAPETAPDPERRVRIGPYRDRVAVGGVVSRTVTRDGITATFRIDVGRGAAKVSVQAVPFVEVRLDGAVVGPTPAHFTLRSGRHKVALVTSGLPPVIVPMALHGSREPE